MRIADKKMWPSVQRCVMGVLLFGCLSLPVLAETGGLNLSRTRLIYPADAGQVSVVVNNTSSKPYLVTARISRSRTGRESTPFLVSPPLFRLDGHTSNMLRLIEGGQSLPTDRESIFYLNVSGIPKGNPLLREDSGGFVSGHVAYSVGNIIKVFYRPHGLAGNAEQAASQLTFTRTSAGVTAKNASPYYVSLQSLAINGRDIKFDEQQPEMIPPFSDVTYHQMAAFPVSQAGRVTWSAINDLGGPITATGTVQ